MEEEKLICLVKEFSQIEGIQKACRLEYALWNTRKGLILTVDSGGSKAAECPLTGLNSAFASKVVQFLWENAVMPASVRDVVTDLCGAAVCGDNVC